MAEVEEPSARDRWLLLLDGYPEMQWYWPYDQVPYVGQVIGGYVYWWWAACLVRFHGRPRNEIVCFRVVDVDATHVLAEGPIDPGEWSPVPVASLS